MKEHIEIEIEKSRNAITADIAKNPKYKFNGSAFPGMMEIITYIQEQITTNPILNTPPLGPPPVHS